MPIPDFSKVWALFMSDPGTFLATVVVVAIVVGGGAWWLRSYIGKERVSALEERLRLATDRYGLSTEQWERLKPEIAQLRDEVTALRTSSTSAQVEALSATTMTLSQWASVFSEANSALGRSLTNPGATVASPVLITPPSPPASRVPLSEQMLNARVLINGWVLNFNPAIPAQRGSKRISFNSDGTIGDGQNRNEFTWRINNELLEIYRQDGSLQNKFRYDEGNNRFVCTNDPSAKGIRNQIIHRET